MPKFRKNSSIQLSSQSYEARSRPNQMRDGNNRDRQLRAISDSKKGRQQAANAESADGSNSAGN